jgi:hypothetical protein
VGIVTVRAGRVVAPAVINARSGTAVIMLGVRGRRRLLVSYSGDGHYAGSRAAVAAA